jgi:hypothetical protein
MYVEIRTVIEVISAIMCFILLRFMIKPYEITGESRYIGLPLGFGFLGATYVISAFAFYVPHIFGTDTIYLQAIARTFAFIFIGTTYYFSKKPTKNSRPLWKITLIVLITILIALFLILNIPDITVPDYRITRNYLRVLNLIIILYICVRTFRSHIEKPDTKTIWIPFGYVFLAVSQYSLFLFQLDMSISAFFAALILRLVFLSILLIVSFGAFYRIKKRHRDEKDSA